jgi:hypothetical protein
MLKRALPLLLVLAACSGGGEAPKPGVISTDATVTIVTPKPGDVFEPDSVPVELELNGAVIVDETTTSVKPDEGHIHIKLDDETISLLAGLSFDLTEFTEGPVPVGSHVLTVEFVAGNHQPFEPRVIETIIFSVKA